MKRILLSLALLLACGDDDASTDAATEPDSSLRVFCQEDDECSDGVFCNGVERCAPGNENASDFGCVSATADPCLEGQTCEESLGSCTTTCSLSDDADGDGSPAMECGGDDCDDSDPNRYPGNVEVCDADGVDEDCDATTIGEVDRDHDGIISSECCNLQPGGEALCGLDCDDLIAATQPSAVEVCDGRDNDCDGNVDEGVLVEGFADADGDQHGDPGASSMACAGEPRFSDVGDDCDDSAPMAHAAQVEICDSIDNDCDGLTDENARPVTWYVDGDGDGFGSAAAGSMVSCSPPDGYALLPTDCDDDASGVSPVAEELCDGIDNDCNGRLDYEIGPNNFEDDDGDGFVDADCPGFGDDCNDRDQSTHPGAIELCDGRDNDCDGTVDEDPQAIAWYIDRDGDGWGESSDSPMMSREPLAGYVTRGGDCDDSNVAIRPGFGDRCDGRDDDCDGNVDENAVLTAFYVDADGDGAGGTEPVLSCAGDPGVGAFPSDCDDGDANRFPGNPDRCDSIDNDCDDLIDEGSAEELCDIPNASARCEVDVCVINECEGPWRDCDGEVENGCEVDSSSDIAHCSACDAACPVGPQAVPMCADSTCSYTCEDGFTDCDMLPSTGCESATATDILNCGGCDVRCELRDNTAVSCEMGTCQYECLPDFEDCDADPSNGCEAHLPDDVDHCGLCDAACMDETSPVCVRGTCRENPFPATGTLMPFEPDTNTVLPSGVHMFSSVFIAQGITVTTDGDGILEIYSTGPIVVDGTINVSGSSGGRGGTSGTIALCNNPILYAAAGGDTGTPLNPGVAAMGNTGCPAASMGGTGNAGINGSGASCGAGGRNGGGTAGSCRAGGGGGGGYAGGAGGHGGAGGGGNGASVTGDSTGGLAPSGGGEPGFDAYSGENGTGYGGGGGSIGLAAINDLPVALTFRPGSGGGGGGATSVSRDMWSGSGGGGGGGAVRLASAVSIQIGQNGRVFANGGHGGGFLGAFSNSGGGGGGSGGVVYLAAPALEMLGRLTANGGSGGQPTHGFSAPGGPGGAGGVGRIRISTLPESCVITGLVSPALDNGCAPTNPAVSERTYLDIYPF